jgi:hypothetical protein
VIFGSVIFDYVSCNMPAVAIDERCYRRKIITLDKSVMLLIRGKLCRVNPKSARGMK